jgi:hypothetical protein
MSRIVVSEFVTLDGVFQDPGGSGEFSRGGWAFRFVHGPEGDKFRFDELMAARALLLGRVPTRASLRRGPRYRTKKGSPKR